MISRILGLIAIATVWASEAPAQGYPNRPVRVVVAFAPGTTSDIVGRMFADKLTQATGSRAAASVLQFLRIGAEAIEITGCWVNLYAPGAAHRAHSHPNNYLSAVYYLRTWPGADAINFHDPRSQAGVIRPPVTELTSANTDQVVVRVRNGTLLVFPAYLLHSVDANAGSESRVSVSFNLMFAAFTAELSKPLWGDE